MQFSKSTFWNKQKLVLFYSCISMGKCSSTGRSVSPQEAHCLRGNCRCLYNSMIVPSTEISLAIRTCPVNSDFLTITHPGRCSPRISLLVLMEVFLWNYNFPGLCPHCKKRCVVPSRHIYVQLLKQLATIFLRMWNITFVQKDRLVTNSSK